MRVWKLIMLGLLLNACTEPATGPMNETGSSGPLVNATVRPTVLLHPAKDGVTIVTIELAWESMELGAYQGSFRYDPSAVELIEVRSPNDNHRFVNTGDASNGFIRFAGFAISTFESPVAVSLVFRAKGDLTTQGLSVDLEVVGDVAGQQLPQERILTPSIRLAGGGR